METLWRQRPQRPSKSWRSWADWRTLINATTLREAQPSTMAPLHPHPGTLRIAPQRQNDHHHPRPNRLAKAPQFSFSKIVPLNTAEGPARFFAFRIRGGSHCEDFGRPDIGRVGD